MSEKVGISPENYEKLTNLAHLRNLVPEDIEGLREAISQKVDNLATGAIPEKEADDPRAQRECTFEFNWKDGRGKIWKGRFTNKVLSIRDRQLVGIMRSNLAAGISPSNLDAYTGEINLMIAHLAVSLTERPKWAEDLLVLNDVRLLQELYMEVANHESTFLGYGKSPAAG